MAKSENVVERICRDLQVNRGDLATFLGCSRTQVTNIEQGSLKRFPARWIEGLQAVGLDGWSLSVDYDNYRAEEQARVVRVVRERLASGPH